VGTLVQANHGHPRVVLTVCGVPVGKHMPMDRHAAKPRLQERGSIIVVIATDLPLAPHQLKRLARRGAHRHRRADGTRRR
jgi:D-aminopeptidase